MTEDERWTIGIFTVIGVILFIFLVAVGDRGHEFELDNSYENGPNPTEPANSIYPLGVER